MDKGKKVIDLSEIFRIIGYDDSAIDYLLEIEEVIPLPEQQSE